MSEPAHHLDLRYEPSGYRYYLAGRPVHAGDLVEHFSAAAGWQVGSFEWSYDPNRPPSLMFDETRGVLLRDDDQLRWL